MTTCSFSVQSVVCGNQVGELSSPVEITFNVPGVPHVNILPVYSLDGRALAAKVEITNNQSINAYDGFSVPVTSYGFMFSNSTSDIILSSVNTSPCAGDVCEYLPNVSAYCRPSGSISVAVSATNELGTGLSSNPVSIECANELVEVIYNSVSSAITCTFNDPRNITDKSCTVEYGICNSQQQRQTLNGSSTQESPNIVILKLSSIDPNRMYCYNITASNNSFTVIIMGSIGMDGGKSNHVEVIIIIIVFLFVVSSLVVVAILVGLRRCQQRKHTKEQDDNIHLVRVDRKRSDRLKNQLDEINQKLQHKPVEKGRFESMYVDSDCQLQEILANKKLEFRRGCAFYEFMHDVEYISGDKQLIFMKGKDELFSPTVDAKMLQEHGYFGEEISRYKVNVGGYRVFVQSTSASGTRHLPADSMVLYEPNSETKVPSGSLRPLFSTHFDTTQVDNNCSLKDFCNAHHINFKKFAIFLELGATETRREVRDVILAKKDSGFPRGFFTDPSARRIVSEGLDDLNRLQEEWMIFYAESSRFEEGLSLKQGSFVFHQHHSLNEEEFQVLMVDDNHDVQMSSFIKKKLKLDSFENGRAFYEFTGEEDLDYYKEVVNVASKKMTSDTLRLSIQPDVSLFYSFPGTPGLSIKPPKSRDIRRFVQSTSYGSRCLKPGTTVLYKTDVPEREKSSQV